MAQPTYLLVPASGSDIKTNDTAALSITADFDLRVAVIPDDTTPVGTRAFMIAKGTSGYGMTLRNDGMMECIFDDGSVRIVASNKVPAGSSNGIANIYRATLKGNNGAGAKTVKFYVKPTTILGAYDDIRDPSGWLPVGDPQSSPGTAALVDTANALRIACSALGTDTLTGKYLAAYVLNGFDGVGAAVVDLDFTDAPAFPYVESGNSWTAEGAAAITSLLAGDQVVRSFQYEFNGLLMGSGTPYIVEKITGLHAMPNVKTPNTEREDDHGSFPTGNDFISEREIQFDIAIDAVSAIDFEAKMQDLAAAFSPQATEIPFVFMRPGQSRRVFWCKPRRREFPTDFRSALGFQKGSVALVASMPIPQAFTTISASVNVTAGNTSAQVTLTNNGTAPNPNGTITITGPCTNPRIANASDGNRQIKVDIVVGSGNTLVIDIFNKTVKLDGVDRLDALRTDSQWFDILPGDNVVTFSRSTTTGTMGNSIVSRDAWW